MTKQEETMKFITEEIINPLRVENQELKYRVSSLEEDAIESREAVKLYKSLLNEGTIYVNQSSQDCDGVCSYYSYKFTDIDEYFQAKGHYEGQDFEGASSWDVVSVRQAFTEDEQGTFGQGWGIN